MRDFERAVAEDGLSLPVHLCPAARRPNVMAQSHIAPSYIWLTPGDSLTAATGRITTLSPNRSLRSSSDVPVPVSLSCRLWYKVYRQGQKE